MGVKIETQVKNGKYPSKEVFEKYYIEENHTIGETASRFGLTKNIVLNLIPYFNIHKNKELYIKRSSETKIKNNKYPSKDELLFEYAELGSWEKVGEFYGISKSSFARLRKRLGLEEKTNPVLSSKDCLTKYISAFPKKPTGREIAEKMGCNLSQVYYWVEKFHLSRMLNKCGSYGETRIREILFEYSLRKDRSVIKPLELDLFCPAKNIAIEFNGNYWHSSKFKDKYYHFRKSLMCDEKEVRLIHIYEYELEEKSEEISRYLKMMFSDRSTSAPDYKCSSIIKKGTVKLCLRGFDINNQMIFKQSKNKWKLVEYHPEIENILPGSTKYLFDFFVNNFTPQSIFCYCPFDKDNGQILEDVGMNFVRYTPPKKHKIIFHNVESVFYDSGGKYYEYKKEGRGK